MNINRNNMGTLFANGTHKDTFLEEFKNLDKQNIEESTGNIVVYDPYIYQSGKQSTHFEQGRIFSVFISQSLDKQTKKQLIEML